MPSWKICFPSLLVGGLVTLTMLGGPLRVGASPAGSVATQRPPAVPRVVNPDGTLNLAVVTHIPFWAPPGYHGPDRFPAPSSFAQDLTPSRVAHLSLAQRRAAHVAVDR
jgi:hypothetical protein